MNTIDQTLLPPNKNKRLVLKLSLLIVTLTFLVIIVVGAIFLINLNKPSNKYSEIDPNTPLGEVETLFKSIFSNISANVNFSELMSLNVDKFTTDLAQSFASNQLKVLSTDIDISNLNYYSFYIPLKLDLYLPLESGGSEQNIFLDGTLVVKTDFTQISDSERSFLSSFSQKYSQIDINNLSNNVDEYIEDLKRLLEIITKSNVNVNSIINFYIKDVSTNQISYSVFFDGVIDIRDAFLYLKINDIKVEQYENASNRVVTLVPDIQKNILTNNVLSINLQQTLDSLVESISSTLNNSNFIDNSEIFLDFGDGMPQINTTQEDNIINTFLTSFVSEIPESEKNKVASSLKTAFKNLSNNLNQTSLFLNKNTSYTPSIKDNMFDSSSLLCENGTLNIEDIIFFVVPNFLLDVGILFESNTQEEFNLQEFINGVKSFIESRKSFAERKVNFSVSFCTNRDNSMFTGMDFYLSFVDENKNNQYGGFGFFISMEKQPMVNLKNSNTVDITNLFGNTSF